MLLPFLVNLSKYSFYLLFFILQFSFSQTTRKLTFTESPEFKENLKTDEIIAFHTSSSGLFAVINKAKKKIVVNVFDKTFANVNSQIIDQSKNEIFVGSYSYQNKVKLFTEFVSKKEARLLFLYTLNLDSFSVDKTIIKETSVDRLLLYSEMSEHQIKLAISPNQKYIATISDNILREYNSFSSGLYESANDSVIYFKNHSAFPGQFFELKDVKVDENGNIYSIGKLFKEGKRERVGGNANYEYVLSIVSKEENKSLNIKLDDIHVETLSISLQKEQIHLLGLYSEKKSSSIKGVCNFIIDPNKVMLIEKYLKPVELNIFKSSNILPFIQIKEKGELTGFNLDYVIQAKDGSSYLLAEKFYVTSAPSNNSFGSAGGTIYHYDDIIIFKFNSEGKLDWAESIFKKANEHTYNAFLKNDELHLILNSGNKLTKKRDGRTKVSKGLLEKQALYDIVFLKNGEIRYDKILNYNEGYRYNPNLGKYQNNQFVMPSHKGSKKHFMVLE